MARDVDDLEDVDRDIPDPDSPEGSERESAGSEGNEGASKGKEGEGDKGGKKGKEPDEVRELRRELARSRSQFDALNKEFQETSAFWRKKLGAEAPEPEPEADEDEDLVDDTPEKLADEISTQGLAALVKRGVLTKKAAREIIRKEAEKVARQVVGEARQQLTSDQQLIAEFPDLAKRDSELRKLTSEHLKAAVEQDPDARNSPAILRMCAQLAKTELEAKAGRGRRVDADDAQDLDLDDDVDGNRDRESERRRRIDRQDGPRGRRTDEGDNDNSSPLVRDLLKKLDVKPEEYERSRAELSGGKRRGR